MRTNSNVDRGGSKPSKMTVSKKRSDRGVEPYRFDEFNCYEWVLLSPQISMSNVSPSMHPIHDQISCFKTPRSSQRWVQRSLLETAENSVIHPYPDVSQPYLCFILHRLHSCISCASKERVSKNKSSDSVTGCRTRLGLVWRTDPKMTSFEKCGFELSECQLESCHISEGVFLKPWMCRLQWWNPLSDISYIRRDVAVRKDKLSRYDSAGVCQHEVKQD